MDNIAIIQIDSLTIHLSGEKAPDQTPIILIGNKVDLPNRAVTEEEAKVFSSIRTFLVLSFLLIT